MNAFYFWNKVNIKLSEIGKSKEWLCKETGLSLRTMKNRIEKGIQPRLDDAIKILDVFGTTLEEFCGLDNFNYAHVSGEVSDSFKVPVYEQLFSAGHGQFLADTEAVSGYVAVPDSLRSLDGHLAATFVRGNSMEPTLFDGDTIICDNMGYDGKDGLYIIHFEGRGFVKRLVKRSDGITIVSDNPSYSPMFVNNENVEEFRVIGRVRHVMHDINE